MLRTKKIAKAKLKRKPVRKITRPKLKKKAVGKTAQPKQKDKQQKEKQVGKITPPKQKGKPVGKITHFYDQIGVAVVAVTAPFAQGDSLNIGKNGSFFEQKAASMQLDHQPLAKTKKGQEIGLKVKKKVREGDLVFKV